MEINKKDVGLRIKKIRLNHNYTMESFGKLIGAPKSAVNNWEKGRNLPSSERLEKIAILSNESKEKILYGTLEDQVNDYLLDLLLNFDDTNMLLSDELSSYLSYYQTNIKFSKFSDETKANSGLPQQRDMALKDISKQVVEKIIKNNSIKSSLNLTPEIINKNLILVFEDIEKLPSWNSYSSEKDKDAYAKTMSKINSLIKDTISNASEEFDKNKLNHKSPDELMLKDSISTFLQLLDEKKIKKNVFYLLFFAFNQYFEGKISKPELINYIDHFKDLIPDIN